MQPFSLVNYKKGQGPLLHSTVGITLFITRRATEHVSCSKIKEKCLALFFVCTAALVKESIWIYLFIITHSCEP